MRDYKNILAWQKADDLTVAVYEVTRSFPREEVYSLTGQLRRAAYSVPANIAEGASRGSQKDYLHFLYIARGSAAEVAYFIHLAQRLGYLDADHHACLAEQADETSRVLTGLIRSVEKEVGLSGKPGAASPLSSPKSPVSSLQALV
jgi:four helix bundle protein